MLVEGDSIEKAIEYYGTNYKQYDLGWGYFIAEYEEEDYDFQIGFYIDDGCVRFSKFLEFENYSVILLLYKAIFDLL